MNHAEEIGQILLKTSGNTAVVLELEKEVFNQMPILIQALVIRSGLFGILTAGNDRKTALVSDRIDKFLAVVSLICEYITVLQIERGDQISGRRVITDLPARQIYLDWVAQGIDYGMDLRGISTSRTTNSLFFVPPFPPEPCWWTRTYDPSIIYSSLSWSFDSSKKIFSQMPRFVHREYRLYTLFQEPNRSGKSRQGAPVFTIQMMALIIIRLSLAGRPFLPEYSGGTMSLILSHCSSVISCRLIMSLSMPDPLAFLVSVFLSLFYILQTPSSALNNFNLKLAHKPEREIYTVDWHDGVFENKSERRAEEVLAIWLYTMSFRENKFVTGLGRCIAYQIPLNRVRSDSLGKIDLMFYEENTGYLSIVELKNPRNNESINKAIIEIATYNKIINFEKLLAQYSLPKDTMIKKIVLVYKDSIAVNDYSDIKRHLAKQLGVTVLTYKMNKPNYTPSNMPAFESFKVEELK